MKELEEALLDGRADLAVHSAKDLPGELPDGLGPGVVRLVAPEPKQTLVVRELGAALARPMTAQETNIWLTKNGYQTVQRGWTGKIKYEATEKGEPYSEMCDVPLDTGRSQRQLVWRTSMVAVIDAERNVFS